MSFKSFKIFILIFIPVFWITAQAVDVEQWHPTDLSFESTTSHSNPFQDDELTATFTGPGSTTLTIPGFYDGNNTWIVRFAPTKIGEWTYTTTSDDSNLDGKTGSVTCVANTNPKVHGRLHLAPDNKHHFMYEDGTPYFLMGFEANWLGMVDMQDATIVKAKELIDMYAEHGFTNVLMNVYAHDTRWKTGITESYDWGPPHFYAWKGTNSNPDHSEMNPEYFAHFDRIIDYLFQKGVVAHIYFKVYNKMVDWPNNGTDDDMFFQYVTARYQAYPNIMWNMGKESKYENDSNYEKNRIEFIKVKDAYDRLIGIHDDGSYVSGNASTIDFHARQIHSDWYNDIIDERSDRPNWPAYNAEYGYETVNGSSPYGGTAPTTMFDRTLEIVMAGGYPQFYLGYHSWDIIRTNVEPESADWHKNMMGLFLQTKWYECVPNDDLINTSNGHCLADEGKTYIVYLENGGNVTLTIANASSDLSGKWVNCYTGAEQDAGPYGNGAKSLSAPLSNAPCLLWLTNDVTPIKNNEQTNKKSRL